MCRLLFGTQKKVKVFKVVVKTSMGFAGVGQSNTPVKHNRLRAPGSVGEQASIQPCF